MKFDSLTIIDYIRTSIEILMQMKLDDDKGGDLGKSLKRDASEISNSIIKRNDQTPLSSTTKSLDLPPKEYEQQLQQYEAEVRNHIKVEQQLKLHIEVIQEKLDDLEKEKTQFQAIMDKTKKDIESQIKKQFEQIMEQKDKEIDRLIAEVKKA